MDQAREKACRDMPAYWLGHLQGMSQSSGQLFELDRFCSLRIEKGCGTGKRCVTAGVPQCQRYEMTTRFFLPKP